MKKLFLFLPLILLTSCCLGPNYPKEVKTQVNKNSKRFETWVRRMEKGELSTRQMKEIIRGSEKTWRKMKEIVNEH